MFRRSRFSVRPNVGTAGRTAATPQEAPSSNQEASEIPRDVSESISDPSVTDNKSIVTPSEKTPGDGSDQNLEGSSSSAAVQRRKRFSIKPKVAPGRPATLARTPKSPVKAVSETPVEASGSDLGKPATSSQTSPTVDSQGLKSPRRRRLSENVKQPKVQSKPTSIPSANSASSSASEDSLGQTPMPANSGSEIKVVPPRPPDRVPSFIPDKEAIELSEKAKTLVSSKSGLSLSPSAMSLSRLLNDPSDLQRLAKAQKLRELLREERHKEKRLKKAKTRLKEYTLDPAKMTMRDLIHYLPVSNPMSSSLEYSAEENETVVPTSPGREDRSPERAQEPEVVPKILNQREEENEEADEDQEEELMVPQVKVAEDGSLIIDEESLTVEVQRAKGPNPAQDRDPIFERGSTTTYSSFRKGTCSKPWSSEETDMFFLAVSMVGTDFSMICQLFPHRARAEIKNKFKREERENAWRIDKAFRERRKLDIEYFSKLLEKILEVQKNRKKLKSLAVKNSPKKQKKKKAKGKIAARNLSDVDEEDEEDENHPDLEDEEGGEKENELLCNEGEATASKPKKQQKRKTGKDASNEEPSNKKNNTTVEKSIEQDEPCIPEDTEAALPQDPRNSDVSEKSDKVNTKDTAVKPAKLSRGRAPKPLVPLGRKWGKKVPPPSTKDKGSGDDVSDGASKEQVNEDASPSRISDNNNISSEDEEAPVPPPRPTRYGRVPKPTKLLSYPCKDDEHSSASETTPSSPVQNTALVGTAKPKCTAKRGRSSMPQSDQESKKPKLVSLRASRSNYSDEENDQQLEQEVVEEEQDPACSPSKNSIAPAFVSTSLCASHSKISMVEEAIAELDILANMPDVLGISQDALCPDASCEQAQNEMGTAEPYEHQLDLLVDVIDFLSSEQGEGSEDESYNEAAQTLLTIGNLTHLFQETQNQIPTQDHITGTTSNSETSQHLEGVIPSNSAAHEQSATPCISAASDNGITEASETTLEKQNSTADRGDTEQTFIEQWTGSDENNTPQLQSSPESFEENFPSNLCQTLITAQVISQTETSAVIEPVIESVPEEAAPKIPECTQSLKDISYAEIKLTDEPPGSQERYPQSRCSSSGQFKPNLEHTYQETGSVSSNKDEIIESHSNNLAASDISVEQGSTTDSVVGREDSHGFVSPVEDLHASRKLESEVATGLQSKRSRLQKVKPKPNLSQTCRTGRSKPQVIKSSTEKDCSPLPNAKTVAEVKPEQTSATLPEKSTENIGGASDLTASLDSGSAFKPTQEISTAEEQNTDDGLFVQVGSNVATSDGGASENQNFSEDKFPPSMEHTITLSGSISESTHEKLTLHPELIASGSNLASEILLSKPEDEQESNTDSVPVQENSHHCAGFLPPVEDLPLSQKAKSEVTSTCQSRRSRSQKVIPKPNLPQTSRTARLKPQTTKDSIEKDFSTTSDVKPGLNCATLPDKTTQSTVPASDFIPSLDLNSVLIQREEFSATEVKNIDVGLSGQVDSSIATSGQGASEDENFSSVQAKLEPSGEKANGVTRSILESTEYHCSNLVTSGSAVTELKVGQGSHSNMLSRPESSDTTISEVEAQPTCSTSFPEKSSQSIGTASVSVLSLELSTTHQPAEEQKTDAGFGLDSSSESSEPNVPQKRRRFPKVKPKPNLASSTRTTRSTLHPKGISKTSEQPNMNTFSNLTIEQPSADKSITQTELEPTETGSKNSMSVHSSLSLELIDSTQSAATELKTSLDSTNDKNILATSWVVENCFMLTDSVSENKSGEKSSEDKMSNNPELGAGVSSQGNCTVDVSTSPTELNTQQTDDSAEFTNVQFSPNGSTESKLNSALTTNVNSKLNKKESSHQSCPKDDAEDRSQDEAQQCCETSETNHTSNNIPQSAHSTDESQSTDSSVSSRKAPPTQIARLIKPRPNLGRSSQLSKTQPVVQNATQAEADSGTCSGSVVAVSQKPVSELRPDKKPVEGAVEQHSKQDSHPDDVGPSLGYMKLAVEQLSQDDIPSNEAGSSLGCLTQVPSTQNASEGAQSYPCLTLFPHMLSEQVPTDPDEPFFILSLTEIPVSSSGEVVDSAAEPFSYLPATDASVAQQSGLPGETLEAAAAGDASLSDAAITITTEESGEMSLTNVKDSGLDPTTHKDLIMKNPVDADERTTLQLPKSPEPLKNNNDTEIPTTKQRLRGIGREAKLKGKTTKDKGQRTKQASKSLTADTIQEPHYRGPSGQPEASDATTEAGKVVTEPQKGSGDHVDTQKETLTGVKDSSSGAPTLPTKTRAARRQSRKSKDSISTSSAAASGGYPPCKAVSKSSNVKTSCVAGKRSSTTPHNVASTPSPAQLPDKAHSILSTTSPTQTEVAVEYGSRWSDPATRPSQCTSEVSASQQSDYVESSSVEEEPTNVSQYFLSDIFTEVEEG